MHNKSPTLFTCEKFNQHHYIMQVCSLVGQTLPLAKRVWFATLPDKQVCAYIEMEVTH